MHPTTTQSGFTLVEMMIATALAGLLIAGLNGVIGQALTIQDAVNDKNDLTQQARFAMNQMVRTVGRSRQLLLPLADNPNTNWPEHIREQTVPASPPIGDSTLSTAVLAVTLPLYSDLDGDGFPDADDDRDGRVDEDLGQDRHKDSAPGIYLIDDDGDGSIDEGTVDANDDESGGSIEDPFDGIDNDGDNSIDEDNPNDMNADGCPGVCGVDDDGDGNIDEGDVNSDDEEGVTNEDWYNPVVFYMENGTLMQRTPVPWDVNSSGTVTGRDYIEQPIAENVSRLRVERVSQAGRSQLVDLTLELTSPESGESVSLHTLVRLGGAL